MTKESMRSRIRFNNEGENDLIRRDTIDLYRELTAQHTEDRILLYVERETRINKQIVQRWFIQKGFSINIAFAKKIALSLKNFTPNKLIGIPARLHPPIASQKSPTPILES